MYNFPIYLQFTNSPVLKNFTNLTANSLLFKEQDFPANYLSIKTANTKGLDNWGIILNQSRTVFTGEPYAGVFGFDDGTIPTNTDDYPQNFNHGTFYNPAYAPTKDLTNDEYRALLLLLYQKYTTNNSLASLNKIIKEYALNRAAAGIPYVISYYSMNIAYVFPYTPEAYELNLFLNTDLLPVPLGVNVNIIVSP